MKHIDHRRLQFRIKIIRTAWICALFIMNGRKFLICAVVNARGLSPGHERTCLDVMRGYTVMAAETIDQLLAAGGHAPTHVFIQGGVGGLAAAVWRDS